MNRIEGRECALIDHSTTLTGNFFTAFFPSRGVIGELSRGNKLPNNFLGQLLMARTYARKGLQSRLLICDTFDELLQGGRDTWLKFPDVLHTASVCKSSGHWLFAVSSCQRS